MKNIAVLSAGFAIVAVTVVFLFWLLAVQTGTSATAIAFIDPQIQCVDELKGTWSLEKGECLFGDQSAFVGMITEEECVSSGKMWDRIGLTESWQCFETYDDGGTQCSSSSSCSGECLVDSFDSPEGYCAYSEPAFGCYGVIEDPTKRISCSD